MQHYTYSFLLYLTITIITESIVIFLLLRKLFKIDKTKLKSSTIIANTIFASALTLPYVWYIFPYLISNFTLSIWISEILVLVVESIFYQIFLKIEVKKAFILSLLANLVSYGLGQLLHYLFEN